jgi:hypothetical protein
MSVVAPSAPELRFSVGVTGHREGNAAFARNRPAVEAALVQVFDVIARAVGAEAAPVRLHCLLSDGVDQLAARGALARGWELVAPLPFGLDLNVAINAGPESLSDARALLAGSDLADEATQARARAIRDVSQSARLFELAERDALISRLYLEKLESPADITRAQAFAARCSARVALAGRVMIEQSDIVIGVWDGVSRAFIGGTGHTISEALNHGAAVVWINANDPDAWRILQAPESLAAPEEGGASDRAAELARLVRAALRPLGEAEADYHAGVSALSGEKWHARSNRWWAGYRRIEALFAGDGRPFRSLVQRYETPDAIASGSGAEMVAAARALPGADASFTDSIKAAVLTRFAWGDGISSWLSDAYRGGMIANFLLSAFAVVTGIAYQPLATSGDKWLFASIEFVMLSGILVITWLGGKLRWHGRWFETRRVAEYFRHAPILLLLGVARAPGRWPQGTDVSWPEYYARHGLRSLGLPRVAITPAYLRAALKKLLDEHVVRQRDYHQYKAQRLTAVHHRLDAFSVRLFQLAVLSVAIYLALASAASRGLIAHETLHEASKYLTFLGVAFPTFGAAIAGIRYFGDFERFAAISEVTAAKLDGIHLRINVLLNAPDENIDYARVSDLAHATDDIVVSEIENWQAVFGGKHISVPV